MQSLQPLRVTVVVTTYNSSDYISELLHHLQELRTYRVYVIDDASSDDTVALARQFPNVKVVVGDKNLGPTGNRNRILGHDTGDILIFLDDDMRWRNGDMVGTVRKHFANPKLGIVGFAIFDNKDKELWFANEHELDPLFFLAQLPFIEPLAPAERNQSLLAVKWVLEGAFAIRSELFSTIHGFDSRFKRYLEGVDLGRRVRAANFEVGYTHDTQFTHSRPLSVMRPAHMLLYLKSAIVWHTVYPWRPKHRR